MANATRMCLSSPTCMYGEQAKGMVFYTVSTNNPSVPFGGAAPAKAHPQLVVRVPWSSAWKGEGRTRTCSGPARSPLNGALHSVDLFATFAKSIRHLKSCCISARTPERCIGVVAKIESIDSLTNVFQVPDGAVVARGDLGIPSEEVSSLQQEDSGRSPAAAPLCSRRLALCLVLISAFVTAEGPAQARARKKKSIPIEDYQTSGDGLKFYDITEGKGPTADTGSTAVVHFDCVYKGLTVVSSRESKLLGGNRIIAEPYEFVIGSVPGKERKEAFVEYANGLYSAQAAPKPPPALYSVTAGMRVGGQRTVIVPPELGYGTKGFAEIPSGATIELNIELLEVKKTM